jgi:HPt (histidine-containing phosphotransfer) domain-containing protein
MGMKRYNLNYLKEISGGDEDFILDMIQTFVANTPGEIDQLRAYAEKEQWELLGDSAHKFAPGLQFLGIIALRPVINQLEDYAKGKKKLEIIPSLIDKLDTECRLVSEELKQDFKI